MSGRFLESSPPPHWGTRMNVYTDTPPTSEVSLSLEVRPSASSRWLACPGSVWVSAVCLPLPATLAADTGTVAHWLLQNRLAAMFGLPADGRPRTNHPVEIDDGITTKVSVAADAISTFSDWAIPSGYIPSLELSVGYRYESDGYRLIRGTADFVAHSPNITAVIDYKNGRWCVDPKNNTQLLIYALAVRQMFGPSKSYWLGIMQPEIKADIAWWIVDNDKLDLFEINLLEALRRINSFPTFFKSGEHCHFCPGKLMCPAKAMEHLHAAVMLNASRGSDPANAWLIERADALKSDLSKMQEETIQRINAGQTVADYAVITEDGRRTWKSDILETLKTRAREIGITETVEIEDVRPITISEAEKLGISTEGLTERSKKQRLVRTKNADTLKGF
jgi:hypothetical protein